MHTTIRPHCAAGSLLRKNVGDVVKDCCPPLDGILLKRDRAGRIMCAYDIGQSSILEVVGRKFQTSDDLQGPAQLHQGSRVSDICRKRRPALTQYRSNRHMMRVRVTATASSPGEVAIVGPKSRE